MNSALLKRLFKAISEGSDDNIEKVCRAVINDSKEKNHNKLASDLEKILNNKPSKSEVLQFRNLKQSPSLIDKNKELSSFATILSRESLEHYMVLPSEIEGRFQNIEKEYAARERLQKYSLAPRKKILLYGPPGCGKTLGAKRLAWTIGLDLVKVKFDTMVSSLFGESASNLRSIFDYCQHNPSVLLLDECDFIARSRENSKDIGEVHRIVNTLLQLLEDYDPPGLVVATTNLVDQLDKALFRRFDDALLIPVPGEDEIIEIMKASTSGLKLKPKSFPWEKVSSNLLGTSAANIVSISRNACKDAVLKNKDVLELSNFEKALKDFNRLD